jgi:hypothetical protein
MSFSKSTLFQKIESDENFQDESIKSAIETLRYAGNDTSKNQEALFSFPKHAYKIAVGLNTLKDDEALTEQNRLRICAHAELANEIAVAIIMLHRSNIYTLSNWLLLAKAPERANAIAASFEYLKKADIFTEKNKKDICTIHSSLDKENSTEFGNALSVVFYDGNLTQENFDKLSADPKNAWQIEKELKRNVSKRNAK